jgi:hypothetical protein
LAIGGRDAFCSARVVGRAHMIGEIVAAIGPVACGVAQYSGPAFKVADANARAFGLRASGKSH